MTEKNEKALESWMSQMIGRLAFFDFTDLEIENEILHNRHSFLYKSFVWGHDKEILILAGRRIFDRLISKKLELKDSFAGHREAQEKRRIDRG